MVRCLGVVLAAVTVVASCTAPITTRGDDALRISGELGAPVMPLESGLYALSDLSNGEGDNGLAGAFTQTVGETHRPLFADAFILQRHGSSESYATSYGNMRFYALDGETFILELFSETASAVYLPARFGLDSADLTILLYNCEDIPSNYRQSQGLDNECLVTDVGVLLRAFGLMDLNELDQVAFRRIGEVPDRG